MRKRKEPPVKLEALKEEEKEEKTESAPGFDCNICFELAKEPVVTCCGHLFCWPCLYQWLHVHNSYQECPVCKGKVNESGVVPIYGRGSSEVKSETKSEEGEGSLEFKIPPRPQGNRVESLRQQLLSRPYIEQLEELLNLNWQTGHHFHTWHLAQHTSSDSHTLPAARGMSRATAFLIGNGRLGISRDEAEPGVSQTSNSSTAAVIQGVNAHMEAGPSRRVRRRGALVSAAETAAEAVGVNRRGSAAVFRRRGQGSANAGGEPRGGRSTHMTLRSMTRAAGTPSTSASASTSTENVAQR